MENTVVSSSSAPRSATSKLPLESEDSSKTSKQSKGRPPRNSFRKPRPSQQPNSSKKKNSETSAFQEEHADQVNPVSSKQQLPSKKSSATSFEILNKEQAPKSKKNIGKRSEKFKTSVSKTQKNQSTYKTEGDKKHLAPKEKDDPKTNGHPASQKPAPPAKKYQTRNKLNKKTSSFKTRPTKHDSSSKPLKHNQRIPEYSLQKVVIRGLPPDLPSHTFWKSVEKSLPWYQEANEGHFEKVSRKVSSVLLARNSFQTSEGLTTEKPDNPSVSGSSLNLHDNLADTNSNDNNTTSPGKTGEDNNNEKSDFPVNNQTNPESSGTSTTNELSSDALQSAKDFDTNKDPASKKQENDDDNNTLYLGLTEFVTFEKYVSKNLQVLEQPPYFKYFYPGKVSVKPLKTSSPSRAYINFKTQAEAETFVRNYSNHKFVSKDKNVTVAKVEYAIFQMNPNEHKSKPDILVNTIGKDKDFLEFVNSKKNAEKQDDSGTPQSNNLEPTSANPDIVRPDSKLDNENSAQNQNKEETPSTAILDYLRKKKKIALKKSSEKKLARATKKRDSKPSNSNKSVKGDPGTPAITLMNRKVQSTRKVQEDAPAIPYLSDLHHKDADVKTGISSFKKSFKPKHKQKAVSFNTNSPSNSGTTNDTGSPNTGPSTVRRKPKQHPNTKKQDKVEK
ncbi:hypothetical protein BB560_007107 [Smittium megazygosporum]|uniref:UPF3 domain-containing protein n=1 Tax=Smittium megazygosporum TaxID=133381 RepID=A0A2T9XYQ6_9FUNG|nr:hypothetical protein BB560_007107 [Smittium megazygosporum]